MAGSLSSSNANHQAQLFKLKQTTIVAAFQAEFEKLNNQVDGLTPTAIRNCFIYGLRSDIQNEIAIHSPTTLHQTYGLAKLIKDMFSNKPRYPSTRSYPTTVSPPVSTPSSGQPTNHDPLLTTPPPTNTLPLTRLSPEALQKRKAEGLCFRYPAKYSPGHKCKPYSL